MWIVILVEQAVWLVVVSDIQTQCVSTLWDSKHMLSGHCEIKADRVASYFLVLRSFVFGGLLRAISVVLPKRSQDIFCVIVQVVVIIDNHGLLSIDILYDPEWIKLHFVRNSILTLD